MLQQYQGKKKWISISILFCAIVLCLAILGPDRLLNSGIYRSNLEKSLQKNLGIEVLILGPAKFAWLPQPSIVFRNVVMKAADSEILNARKITLPVTPSLIMGGSGSISNIQLEEGYLNIDNLYHTLTQANASSSDIRFDKIVLRNYAIRSQSFPNIRKWLLPNLTFTSLKDGTIAAKSMLFYQNRATEITGKFKQYTKSKKRIGYDFNATLSTPGSTFEVSGKEREKQGLQGDIFIHLKDFEQLNDYLHIILNQMSRDASSTPIRGKSPLKKRGLTIGSSFVIKENGDVMLNKFNSTGPITGVKGEIGFNHQNKKLGGYLEVSEVDFSKILRNDNAKDGSLMSLVTSMGTILRSLLINPYPDLSAVINVKVDKTRSTHGESAGFSASLGNIDRLLLCNGLNADLQQMGEMNFVGVIAEENNTPKMSGQIEVAMDRSSDLFRGLALTGGKNLIPSTDTNADTKANAVATIPKVDTNAKINLQLNMAPGRSIIKSQGHFYATNFSAEAALINSISKQTIDGDIAFDKIDLDLLNVDKMVDRYLLIHYMADPDIRGDTYYRLTDNFAAIRNLRSLSTIKAKAQTAIFKGEKIENLGIEAQLQNGSLKLKSKIKSAILSGNFGLSLRLRGFKPMYTIDGQFTNCDLRRVIKNLPDRKTLLTQAAADPVLRNFVALHKNDVFNKFSSNHYDADVGLKIENLSLSDEIDAKNMDFGFNLSGGVLNLKQCRAEAFDGGTVDIRARIILYELIPSFYAALNMSNFNPEVPLSLLIGKKKMSGYASMGGSLSTSGNTMEKIKQNLVGKITFIGKNIAWDGLDISKAINSIDEKNKAKQKIANVNKALSDGESFFDDIQASITINSGMAKIEDGQFNNNRIGGNFALNYSFPFNSVNSIVTYYFILMGDYVTRSIAVTASGPFPNYDVKYLADDLIRYIENTSENDNTNENKDSSTNTLRHQLYQ